jgi:hypothetical protein
VKLLKLACLLLLAAAVVAGCGGGSSSTDATAAATSSSPPPTTTPSPSAGSATLSWTAPTTDTNGQALTNLAGYRIYYGTSAGNLSQAIVLNSTGTQTYVIENLAPGTWYFAIAAFSSAGTVSALSDIVSKTIG